MRVEHIGRTHAIDGKRVKGKRPAVKNRTPGTLVLLEGGKSRFYPKGSEVEVTGYTESVPAGLVRPSAGGPRLNDLSFEERAGLVFGRR